MWLFDSGNNPVENASLWIADKFVTPLWGLFTGTVSPTKLEIVKRQSYSETAQASGVGVGGKTVVTSKGEVKRRQEATTQAMDSYLRSQGTHPDQAELRIAGVNIDSWDKVRSLVIGIVAVGIGAYFLVEIGKAYVSRR